MRPLCQSEFKSLHILCDTDPSHNLILNQVELRPLPWIRVAKYMEESSFGLSLL